MKSDLEHALAFHIRAHRLPKPISEYRVIESRRFRFDMAWPDQRVAVEIEGGVWTGGRHTRGAGFERDCEKHNLANLADWVLLRVTSKHIESGQAIGWIKSALAMRNAEYQGVASATK